MVRPTAILSGHLPPSVSKGSIVQTLSVGRFYPPLPPLLLLVMTHFRSDCHRERYAGMNGELRAGRTTTTKRGSGAVDRCDLVSEADRLPDDLYSRVFDYQSVDTDKRHRPSSSSSSSSSTALRMKSSRSNNKHTSSSSSSDSKLKMSELLSIKRELTVIKVQVDGLLDCVDKMDRQREDCSECPQVRGSRGSRGSGSPHRGSGSPHRGSVSSLEPGEASEDEELLDQQYYYQRIKQHQSDQEDDL